MSNSNNVLDDKARKEAALGQLAFCCRLTEGLRELEEQAAEVHRQTPNSKNLHAWKFVQWKREGAEWTEKLARLDVEAVSS